MYTHLAFIILGLLIGAAIWSREAHAARKAVILLLLSGRTLSGRQIRDKYHRLTNKKLNFGTLYATLAAMEDSGTIRGWSHAGSEIRGMAKQRMYERVAPVL